MKGRVGAWVRVVAGPKPCKRMRAGLPFLGLQLARAPAATSAAGCRLRRPTGAACAADVEAASIGSHWVFGRDGELLVNGVHTEVSVRLALACAVVFALAFAAVPVAGALALAAPPRPRTTFGAIEVPDDADCLRASRYADYTTVEVALGTPRVVLSLLLQLDNVVDALGPRLISTRVVESKTVGCQGAGDTARCEDLVLLQRDGPRGENVLGVLNFSYHNFVNEEYYPQTPAFELGLDGEMRLVRGSDYFLTPTHLCWTEHRPTPASDGTVVASVAVVDASTGRRGPVLAAARVELHPLFAAAEVGNASQAARCFTPGAPGETEDAHLFPVAAAHESTWLAIGSPRVYEVGNGVEDRRDVVEVGPACAANAVDGLYERPNSLYQLDCSAVNVPCATGPTVPFRHVAKRVLRFQLPPGSAEFRVDGAEDATLGALPANMSAQDAFGVAILKLALMALTAAVLWIRAAKNSSSNKDLVEYHLTQRRSLPAVRALDAHPHRWWEDMLVGLCAVLARLLVALWRREALTADGFERLVWVQVVGAVASTVHCAARYGYAAGWRWQRDQDEDARTQEARSALLFFGGSTAIADATSAVLLGFCEPPMLQTAADRFDPTARLLCGLLISLVAAQRIAFAATACAARVARNATTMPGDDGRQIETTLSVVGVALWIGQGASVGLLLADGFALPQGYSLTRAVEGGWTSLALAVLGAALAAAQPQMIGTYIKLAALRSAGA